MEPAGPARLYASAVGALLVVLGVVGFFYGSSFGSPGTLDRTLGVLRTNGWENILWFAVGALGLLTAGSFSRAYALGAGLLLTVLGVWGLALDPGAANLGFLPAADADEALNLTLGILGLLAAAGTPRREPARSGSAGNSRAAATRGRPPGAVHEAPPGRPLDEPPRSS
jgi:hypothetical protein